MLRLSLVAVMAAVLSGCVVVPAGRYHDGAYRDGDRREYRDRDGDRGYYRNRNYYQRDGSRTGGWSSP